MHDDSTATDHDIKSHCQTPGGLAKMTHWRACSCGWESDRGVGYSGFDLAKTAAREHAAQYGVPFLRPPDDLVTPEARADWYLQQIPDEDMQRLCGKLADLLISSARNEANQQRQSGEPPETEPVPRPKRTRSLKPSSIAAFEAQWQAEHADDEAES